MNLEWRQNIYQESNTKTLQLLCEFEVEPEFMSNAISSEED